MARIIAVCAWLLAAATSAHATVPPLINFQGSLKDSLGSPVADSSYAVTFTIYDSPAGGTALWTESQPVSTTDGRFAILLGASVTIPDSAFRGSERWLGVAISPDPEMPRQQLVSVGYAFRVSSIDSAQGGTIVGNVAIGPGHTVTGLNSVAFGENSTASGDHSTIGGGYAHLATAIAATIGGGGSNTVNGPGGTIGGGSGNVVAGQDAVVAGGAGNHADGRESAVCGGAINFASGAHAFVGGGIQNEASDTTAAVAGGRHNKARGRYSFIGGGGSAFAVDSNAALGDFSVIGGGQRNITAGLHAAIPGGSDNAARGDHSLAAGRGAKANHAGTVVVSAGASGSDSVASSGDGQVVMMGTGGFYLADTAGTAAIPAGHFLETSTGAFLTDVGVWTNASSRAYKTDIEPLHADEYAGVLNTLAAVDVVRFRYKSSPERRHLGMIAEDVPDEIATESRNGIPTADAIAFLMAAVKAQQAQIEAQQVVIAKLNTRLDRLVATD